MVRLHLVSVLGKDSPKKTRNVFGRDRDINIK